MRSFALTFALAAALPPSADGRSSGDPIRLAWSEGDVAGMSTVWARDGSEAIGFVEYHQTRRGDRLSSLRIARFRDGSSDEDSAEAAVGETLQALSGRSIIRDVDGEPIVDLRIDVEAGRIEGTWGRGTDRRDVEEHVALPKGTYWGPLIFIVLKNFDANAEDGQLVFRTVAPTPKPMVIDMALIRGDEDVLERTGLRVQARRFELSPTVHWTVDPLVRLIAPRATFWILPGEPPALARFTGPRNYGRQGIMIQ
jgi:hypothetical protein